MDMVKGAVIIAAMAAGVVVYAIHKMAQASAADRRIRHEQFMARLVPEHVETIVRLTATRDAEIAKATKTVPSQLIDMKRAEG
ncbi:hypothetical protein; putative signal peptide [Bradyrhizobium sp. ORS 278]|uniref:hypothetical protein n=1 Tax=Bradyrhizobium sp. (strain ORS 278) TaxID=114615 RepID=UPI0001508F4E|nr:hypothetical protein [Bradyrhizobium sp. ORS 278]CAL77419.1 hypothetical protein; putative signal peptide [Bradyrhizobium sp. ORS 278]